ncbi:MAG: hypothetical protein AB1736_08610 [Chloroflexota bacterium]
MTPRRRRATDAPTLSADPLAGVERVFIDGSNLVHALARGSTGPVAPPSAIVARIRGAFPPSVVVDLVFDGAAAGGVKGRLATGLRVAYSGRLTADQVIDDGVAAQLAMDGPAGTWGILVVTDDRGLRDAVGAMGARTAGTAWLTGRIGRLATGAHGEGPDRGPRPAGRTGRASRHPAPAPLPKAGTTFGHRRPPRPAASDRD